MARYAQERKKRLLVGLGIGTAVLAVLILISVLVMKSSADERAARDRAHRDGVAKYEQSQREGEQARANAPTLDTWQLATDVQENPVRAREKYSKVIYYVTGIAQIENSGLYVHAGNGFIFLCSIGNVVATLNNGEMVGVTGRIETERQLAATAPRIFNCRLERHGTTADVAR